jgi:Rod binding domain-containing protein
MNISSLQPQIDPTAIPLDQLAANPNVAQSDKVKEASRQFEAVLLRQILGEARKTVIHSSTGEDSNERGIYNDMINYQMADRISKSGSFGLSRSIEKQLVHQVLPGADASPTDEPSKGTPSTPARS